ncbi:YybH family protein [Draconibacterium halophilum]|uniref:Nuclear transport factor 2 family protein n=1 Tax=Draconibacterium halophilum TaxID=2706887 RepID=A0A6C0RFT2_9BACT|nr:nuclear transport factor 2 family protein [Draconibacterium halophilum]QIA08692.1 nuclear transport factor 2 family protein [Draconibacterium halophilum]
MRKTLVISIIFLLFSNLGFTQEKITENEKEHILLLLDKQTEAWNEGDLEKFMETYWKSDKLVFMGSRGPTYGWQATLDGYKKGYPGKTAMGHLEFKILDLRKIDTKTVFLIGRYELTREIGDLIGHFTLIIQKIDGGWVIISDHSSGVS